MDEIIAYRQRIGTTDYISGDRIDVEVVLREGLLNDVVLRQLRQRQEIVEATPETFKVAMARRPTGSPWPPRGFTQAYLEEKGLVPKDEALAPVPAKKKAQREVGRVDRVTLTDEKIAVGKHFLQPTKRNKFTFYHAVDAEGRVLRAQMFNNKKAGAKFLEELQAADTPAGNETAEAEHGSDLQRGSVDGNQSDPPAPG